MTVPSGEIQAKLCSDTQEKSGYTVLWSSSYFPISEINSQGVKADGKENAGKGRKACEG